jgi:RNA polymerase sigma factor (sigma-70 family)
MLKAHKNLDRFTGRTGEEFYYWLRCLLRHKFSDFVRAYRTRAKRQIRREVSLHAKSVQVTADRRRTAPEAPTEVAIHQELIDGKTRALTRAPEEIRELIRLRFDERLTYSDIGARLGLNAEVARKLLTRTLRLLGEELAE